MKYFYAHVLNWYDSRKIDLDDLVIYKKYIQRQMSED